MPLCSPAGRAIACAPVGHGNAAPELRELGASGCCLVGHPVYHRKFGFENVSGLAHEGVPPEFFLALPFDGRLPQGTVVFHAAFRAEGLPRA